LSTTSSELHPAFEVADVPAIVALVPINCLPGDHRESNALLLHVRRHLGTAQDVSFTDLIKLDGVPAPADLFAVLDTIHLEAKSPLPARWS